MTEQTYRPSRRIVFQGLGALGIAVALAGCGSGDSGDDEASTPDAGSELASTSEVPGRRRGDPRRAEGRHHPADRGRVQGVHRGLHPPGLHRGRGPGDHQLQLPPEQVLHRGRLGAGRPGCALLEEVAINVDGDKIVAA